MQTCALPLGYAPIYGAVEGNRTLECRSHNPVRSPLRHDRHHHPRTLQMLPTKPHAFNEFPPISGVEFVPLHFNPGFIYDPLIRLTFLNGRGGRNRTHTNGFGDRCSTVKLRPYENAGSGGGNRTHDLTGMNRTL
ncbi:hypothetical protein CULT_380055 [[Clostridium] ultunense Esp]|nr:hypothetical protein CULT_380055 [[Clostridium] ultunense Esp]